MAYRLLGIHLPHHDKDESEHETIDTSVVTFSKPNEFHGSKSRSRPPTQQAPFHIDRDVATPTRARNATQRAQKMLKITTKF